MATILVTGASGFVGSRLVKALGDDHKIIALSRQPCEGAHIAVRGDFTKLADLHQLDSHAFDAVVHLGAVMGGSPEELALSVNTMGAQQFLRYSLDRGCRRLVLASSIAAAGCLDTGFASAALPIADDHPCRATEAYGFSKHLLEQLAHYFARATPDCEIVSVRIGSVMESHGPAGEPATVADPPKLPFLFFGKVRPEDVIAGLRAIVSAAGDPGSRIYNLVGPDIRTDAVVASVLRAALGDRGTHLDMAPYETTGRQSPPIWAMDALRRDYDFTPQRSVN